MFSLKRVINCSTINVVKEVVRYSTNVNVSFDKIEPTLHKLINEELKKNQISKCSLNLEYSSVSKTYKGRFKATIDTTKFHENELNYYVEMSNKYALKN